MPRLRARLRGVRSRELALERELAERGIDACGIGPWVPAETAIDPTPRPGEWREERRKLEALPRRRGLLARLCARLTRGAD